MARALCRRLLSKLIGRLADTRTRQCKGLSVRRGLCHERVRRGAPVRARSRVGGTGWQCLCATTRNTRCRRWASLATVSLRSKGHESKESALGENLVSDQKRSRKPRRNTQRRIRKAAPSSERPFCAFAVKLIVGLHMCREGPLRAQFDRCCMVNEWLLLLGLRSI